MRVLDGIRILGPDDGTLRVGNRSTLRELVGAGDTDDRWSFGEVVAEPDESVGTHLHPGEPEAIVILEGDVELHGAHGIAQLHAGDVAFIPPDTEHGLRTPTGATCGSISQPRPFGHLSSIDGMARFSHRDAARRWDAHPSSCVAYATSSVTLV